MSLLHSDPTQEPIVDPPIQLVPASLFSVEALTAAYNQTRVDYMIPMPMNAARLQAYMDVYDVDLSESVVAMEGDQILGLGMLGVREQHAWITRLGVLPFRRRRGTGEAIMRGLLESSERMGMERAVLEVIKGNGPASSLFHKLGFVETRELLVLRRPPGRPIITPEWRVSWLDQEDALDAFRRLLKKNRRACLPAWTNEVESLQNAGDCMGLQIDLENGGRGWMIFRRQKFTLSHFIFHTEVGRPVDAAAALISHLYQRFPLMDTFIENMPADDPHLAALVDAGFIEVFSRIELERVFTGS